MTTLWHGDIMTIWYYEINGDITMTLLWQINAGSQLKVIGNIQYHHLLNWYFNCKTPESFTERRNAQWRRKQHAENAWHAEYFRHPSLAPPHSGASGGRNGWDWRVCMDGGMGSERLGCVRFPGIARFQMRISFPVGLSQGFSNFFGRGPVTIVLKARGSPVN